MTQDVKSILDAALCLTQRERAMLADKLLDSLNGDEIEQAWVEEAERRLAAYDRGDMKGIPAEKVFPSLASRKKP